MNQGLFLYSKGQEIFGEVASCPWTLVMLTSAIFNSVKKNEGLERLISPNVAFSNNTASISI